MVLDHLFVCVEPEPAEADALRALGFTVEFRREHPGQGTANLLLLFPEHYLELLFVVDRTEAEGARVRLDRRADWRTTGASPFGVALRGPITAAPEVPWVPYALPGFPAGLWIDGRTLDDPRLPLVFAFDRPELAEGGPRHGGYPSRLLQHGCGATGIATATLEGPGLGAAPKLPLPATVTIAEGPRPRMKLRLQGPRSIDAEIEPLLRLRSGVAPGGAHPG